MPGRSIRQGVQSTNPQGMATVLNQLAGHIDTPMAVCRVRVIGTGSKLPLLEFTEDFGGGSGGSGPGSDGDVGPGDADGNLRLKFTVVDRVQSRFAPVEFNDEAGKKTARWLVHWYVATSLNGAPIDVTPTYTVGLGLTSTANLYIARSNERGIIEVEPTKADPVVYVFACVAGGLLTIYKINWADGTVVKL